MRKDRTITSYAMAKAIVDTARYPKKGKPYGTGVRLFDRGDHVEATKYDTVLAKIYPDDTFELCVETPSYGYNVSLERLFNLHLPRIRSGVYRVMRRPDQWWVEVDGEWRHPWLVDRDAAPEYFPGIRFDFQFNCLNRRGDTVRVTDDAKARQWKRQLAKFRRQWAVRAKVGAFDSVIDEVVAMDWHARRSAQLTPQAFYDAIVNNKFDELPFKILARDWYQLKYQIETFDLAGAASRAYASMRDEVRKIAGCFEWGREPE